MVPNQLVRVQFRCVGGEPLHLKTRMTRQQLEDGLAAVNRAAVPDQDDVAGNVTQEIAQEDRDLDVSNVGLVEVDVQPAVETTRTDRHGGNRRDLVAPVGVGKCGEGRSDSRLAHLHEPAVDELGWIRRCSVAKGASRRRSSFWDSRTSAGRPRGAAVLEGLRSLRCCPQINLARQFDQRWGNTHGIRRSAIESL